MSDPGRAIAVSLGGAGEASGRFDLTGMARGPWQEDAAHGGAPAGLLARAAEAIGREDDLRLASLSLAFNGPVTLGEIEIRSETVKPGRRQRVVSVAIEAGGRTLIEGRAVLIRRGEVDLPDGVKVVEDAAHALPTTWRGKLIGLHDSDAIVFSFYANKTMTTGEGGMLVTRDAALAKRAKVMRLHGMSRDAFDRFTATVPSWYYEIVAPGFKYNLTDIAASLGLHQLRKAQGFQQRRAQIAAQYHAGLAGLPLVLPADAPAGELHAWHLYTVRLADGAPVDRDAAVQALFDAGIGCSVHYIPLHQQPYWRERYGLQPAQFPNSQRAYERLFSLPIYTRMSDADVQRVVAVLRSALS